MVPEAEAPLQPAGKGHHVGHAGILQAGTDAPAQVKHERSIVARKVGEEAAGRLGANCPGHLEAKGVGLQGLVCQKEVEPSAGGLARPAVRMVGQGQEGEGGVGAAAEAGVGQPPVAPGEDELAALDAGGPPSLGQHLGEQPVIGPLGARIGREAGGREGAQGKTRLHRDPLVSFPELAATAAAQAAYDPIAGRADAGMLPQSLQLEQATNNYEAAKAGYDSLFAEPEAYQIAEARAQVKQAESVLERVLRPATEGQIAEANAAVRQAQARVDLLAAGARAEELAAATAAVAQAQAALDSANEALADTELRAPFSGTLAALHVTAGEQAAPGAPIAEVGDLSQWQVETSDLAELDVPRIQEGQAVTLTFDAIPGLSLRGSVVRIQPLGVEKVGDVTYKVVIQPAEKDQRLRWNMTAVVTVP